MVQLFADPTSPHHVVPSPGSEPMDGAVMSREEHAQRMKELNKKRAMMRTPRRGWSMTDYQGDAEALAQPTMALPTSQFDHRVPIPENAPWPPATPSPLATPEANPEEEKPALKQSSQLPQRPKLPPPRRSYSVMDYEPAPPNQPRPSARLTILDLPSELHYQFCDYLDPIDSVCFGLAHSKLYDIHRRKYGTVPLSSRYSGPNDMEWAWRGAGPLVSSAPKETSSERAHMRTKGQVYCRKCGIHRCELHRHLKEWMGEGMEYCEIKEMYGTPAGEDQKPYCYMKSPRNPHRCGRHGGKKA